MRELAQMQVCFLAGTLGQGGAERQLFYLLKALRQSGANVRLLCLTQGEFWEQPIRELGVEVSWVGRAASKTARLRRIVAELRARRPDVLQSQHFYTNLYAATAARALGVKEIGALRNDCISEVQANGAVLGRLNLRIPRVLAANSRVAIGNAVALGVPAARLHLLPNVLDVEQFTPDGRSEQTSINLLAVGRLVEQKRMDRVLDVVARVRERTGQTVKARIVGDGPLRSQLETQAATLGLSPDVVEFKGAVADMRPYYQAADLLLLTSDWEGTPNVVLEAMAAGLPVVATKAGGVPDIIEHGQTGFLAATEDVDSLTEFVINLSTNRSLRIECGRRGRAYVSAQHSLQRLPDLLQQLYRAALADMSRLRSAA